MKILQARDGVRRIIKEPGLEKSEPLLLANGDLEFRGNVTEQFSRRGKI